MKLTCGLTTHVINLQFCVFNMRPLLTHQIKSYPETTNSTTFCQKFNGWSW